MGRLGLLFLAAVLVTGGTVVAGAQFTDTDPIQKNTACAGTFDLKVGAAGCTNMGDSASGVIVVKDMAPGVESGKYWFCYKNADISTMRGQMSFDAVIAGEADQAEIGEFKNIEVGPNKFAKALWLTEVSLDKIGDGLPANTDIAKWWALQIAVDAGKTYADAASAGLVAYSAHAGSWVPTLYGMTTTTFYLWDSYSSKQMVPVAPGECYCNDLMFMLDPDVGNEFQNDGVAVTINVTMDQYEGDMDELPS